jgi:tRNA U34 5-carboxymethylaminomethyl modifying enzyme MnmG/GidA
MSEGGKEKKARTVGFGAFLVALVAFIIMGALAGYIFYSDSNNYRALQQSYDQQTQVLTALNSNYTALYGQYNALLSSHVSLQASYENMTQIANLQKNQTIASGTMLHIPMNSFESVLIQTSYAGYIQVQLQATAPVNLMLTNYKYLTTIDYPISGSKISSGSFTLPVLDGTNYFEIYAPSDSDTTLTLTIILFY